MSAPEPVSDVQSDQDPTGDALFALSRDLVCAITLTGSFTRVSDSCARLTGFQPQLLVGQPLLSLVHPLDRRLAERAFAAVLERGYADDVPTRFRTFAGGHVSLRWTAVRDTAAGRCWRSRGR